MERKFHVTATKGQPNFLVLELHVKKQSEFSGAYLYRHPPDLIRSETRSSFDDTVLKNGACYKYTTKKERTSEKYTKD